MVRYLDFVFKKVGKYIIYVIKKCLFKNVLNKYWFFEGVCFIFWKIYLGVVG